LGSVSFIEARAAWRKYKNTPYGCLLRFLTLRRLPMLQVVFQILGKFGEGRQREHHDGRLRLHQVRLLSLLLWRISSFLISHQALSRPFFEFFLLLLPRYIYLLLLLRNIYTIFLVVRDNEHECLHAQYNRGRFRHPWSFLGYREGVRRIHPNACIFRGPFFFVRVS
jgi:hypothetical protein